jgi:hypothetical protein
LRSDFQTPSHITIIIFGQAIAFVTGPVNEAMTMRTAHDGLITLEFDEFLGGNIEMAYLTDTVFHGSDCNACLFFEKKMRTPKEVRLQLASTSFCEASRRPSRSFRWPFRPVVL